MLEMDGIGIGGISEIQRMLQESENVDVDESDLVLELFDDSDDISMSYIANKLI